MVYRPIAVLCAAVFLAACDPGPQTPPPNTDTPRLEEPAIAEEPLTELPTGNDAEPPAVVEPATTEEPQPAEHAIHPDATQPEPLLANAATCPTPGPAMSHDAETDALLAYVNPRLATVCAVKSGNASDPTVWSKTLKDGDNVWIPPGITVTYDLDDSPRFGWLNAEGNFVWGPNAYDMIVDTFVSSGSVVIGTDANPAKGSITFGDYGDIDITKDVETLSRGFIAMGDLSIRGETKTNMTRLSAHAAKGATTITVKALPSDWIIGDEIVIAAVKTFCPAINGVQTCETNDEVRRIAGTNGNVITLDKPLAVDHTGPKPFLTAHVANLTRSFKFKNENEQAPIHQRGHFMTMAPSSTIKYAEFRWLGRTRKDIATFPASSFSPLLPTSNVKGRYSLHVHKSGADVAFKHFIQGNSVVGSPGWGYVVHDAWADFDHNVAWSTFGGGFVTEIGNEPGTWTNNIAIRAQGLHPCLTKNFVNDDHWRCGTGFAMARHTIAQNNVCTGSGSAECFGWMTRRDPNVIVLIKKEHLPFPEIALNHPDVNVDIPAIHDFKNNEAYASQQGLKVTKSGPVQRHMRRSYITNYAGWNNTRHDIDLTYTGRYTLINPKLYNLLKINDNRQCSLNLGKNTVDLTIIDPVIDTTIRGICNREGVTSQLSGVPLMYTVINPTCTNCTSAIVGPNIQVLPTKPSSNAVSYKERKKHFATKYTLTMSGTLTDALGSFNVGEGTYDAIKMYGPDMLDLYKTVGYCITPSGEKALKVRQTFSGRLSDLAAYADTLVYIKAGDTYFSGPATNNGPC